MRIVDIHERSVPISRYADPSVPSEGLDTTMVVLESRTVLFVHQLRPESVLKRGPP